MPEEFLQDDESLSSDFIFVEAIPDGVPAHPQALWFGVRPGYSPDSEQLREPTIWIQYQRGYMHRPLTGMVAMSPEAWDKLDEAVRWRLKAWEAMYAPRDVHPADPGTGGSGDTADADEAACYGQLTLPFPDGD